MYEGAPDYPDKDIWWELCERYGVTHLLHRADRDPRLHEVGRRVRRASTTCRQLRLLGTVGEPINPKAWLWYCKVIGGERCPIVDTWWQTETGHIMITPLPGVADDEAGLGRHAAAGHRRPRSSTRTATRSAPARRACSTLRRPWPGMLRTLYKDDDRFVETYWSKFGKDDVLRRRRRAASDEDGYFWVIGRVDDVINVSGHRLSTAEVESAIVVAPEGRRGGGASASSDEDTGQSIAAFVTLEGELRGRRRARRRDPRARRQADRQARAAQADHLGRRPARRRARARSCAACCATSPRAASSATSRRCATRTSWRSSRARSRSARRRRTERGRRGRIGDLAVPRVRGVVAWDREVLDDAGAQAQLRGVGADGFA